VIVVSFDALRTDVLGTYGSQLGASPRIDEWAKGSIVFDKTYAVSPVTPTSFASLFTGRLPLDVFRDWQLTAPRTIAQTFSEAGYATGAFLHNPHLVAQRGFGAGFGTYVVEGAQDGRLDERVVSQALRWMLDAQEPFLVWIHLLDPHSPWDRREVAEAFYDSEYEGPYLTTGPGPILAIEDEKELARLRSLYEGEVFAADRLFGQLLDALDRAELLARSIVVLTTDHGEALMDHGMLQHGQLNEEDVRIPLILHHPDLLSGQRVEMLVSQLDLYPTLASLVGIRIDHEVDGRDLRRSMPVENNMVGVAYTDESFSQASLRCGDGRKLIVECGDRVKLGMPGVQLYDLAHDPGERNNLAPSDPDEAVRLGQQLWSLLGIEGCEAVRMNREDVARRPHEGRDDETVRQLKALGYGSSGG